MPPFSPSRWHFDIDHYLNPVVPPTALPRLPYPVAHFLGYRTRPPRPLGNILIIAWAFVGIFCSLALIATVGRYVPSFAGHAVPTIIGSFGAAAVLDFYAIESPLAQPRNAILGQLISSIVGVAINKLFALSPMYRDIRWIGAALSCASATAAMALTGTVHPPAGATALMAVADDGAAHLGWFLIPVVMLGCALMLCMALLVNNVQRCFPFYWWSPKETGQVWCRTQRTDGTTTEEEKPADAEAVGSSSISDDLEGVPPEEDAENEPQKLVITKDTVRVPRGFYLSPEETLLLEALSQRL
ncbi:HPP family protein [Diplogelasinospora grovesii]|uniref:HPP family protein n=1 Tax=Diplogelasinospora grovesii TaxID=303347 RepID=A0AAN6S8G9_9PEZI|nr:HPP family protein [Diplogelasinospora grovesii]